MAAIERWFALFDQVPQTAWLGIPFGIFALFSHCLVLLDRLTTLDGGSSSSSTSSSDGDGDDDNDNDAGTRGGEPGWDAAEARRRVDPLAVLEGLARCWESVPAAAGLVNDTEPGMELGAVFRAPVLIRGLRAKLAGDMAGAGAGAATTATTATLASPTVVGDGDGVVDLGGAQFPEEFAMYLVDDPWLMEMFA